ncbi:hypothetical protein [Dyella humicola]|uniref:hypothetical protein n=1 Tax=Dyella humicola TaxID=2992126 RepID=UPI002259ADDE|nr:hypothetical protein [Dyella humicola]
MDTVSRIAMDTSKNNSHHVSHSHWVKSLSTWKLDSALVIAIAMILVVFAYYLLFSFQVYGYDEPHYYLDWTFKLKEEGRWINFLLHDFLRTSPLTGDAVLFVIVAWVVLYRIGLNMTTRRADACLIASVLLVAAPFADLSPWAASSLPTMVTLLGLSLLASRYGNYRLVYLLGGGLLFGMLQNYYFILPLFFLRDFSPNKLEPRPYAARLLSHGMYWIAGSIVGLICSVAAVYFLTGQLGIVPAPWRHAMPAHNLHDVIRNIHYVGANLKEQKRFLVGIATKQSAVFGVLVAILAVLRVPAWRHEIPRLLVISAVGLSFFAFSVPLAPIIQTRSVITLSIALTLIALVPYEQRFLARVLSIVLLTWAGWNMMVYAHTSFERQKNGNEFVLRGIENALPHAPYGYQAVAIFGEMDSKFPESRILNSPPQMVAIVQAVGAPSYINCMTKSDVCDVLSERLNVKSGSGGEGIRYVGTANDIAVLNIGP